MKLFNKKDDINISKIIKQQNKHYLENIKNYFILPEEGKIKPNPSHINNGFCFFYAKDLKEKLEKLGKKCEYIEFKLYNSPHAVIKYNNKLYDSETPSGVKKVEDLPIYKSLKLELNKPKKLKM